MNVLQEAVVEKVVYYFRIHDSFRAKSILEGRGKYREKEIVIVQFELKDTNQLLNIMIQYFMWKKSQKAQVKNI